DRLRERFRRSRRVRQPALRLTCLARRPRLALPQRFLLVSAPPAPPTALHLLPPPPPAPPPPRLANHTTSSLRRPRAVTPLQQHPRGRHLARCTRRLHRRHQVRLHPVRQQHLHAVLQLDHILETQLAPVVHQLDPVLAAQPQPRLREVR